MPAVRDVLGHVSIETADKRRKCHRKPSKHSIAKGETCLVIRGGPFNSPKNYCKECALEILDRATASLAALKKGLA